MARRVSRHRVRFAAMGVLAALALVASACGGAAGTAAPTPSPEAAAEGTPEGTIRVYASVTQDTVDAVLGLYRDAFPGATVEVFRAPTGELNARIAAERREGELQADVLWLTDPPSMQAYAAQDLLREWTPEEAGAVPPEFREDTFWGTRVLTMVIVHEEGLDPAPTAWEDLAEAYPRPVAVPDPGFAGSAFGALGYFALSEDFGFAYYQALAAAGAVQVQAPGEVVTGVAEGAFSAGMTLDRLALDAADEGSPIAVVHPEPGAIAMYSPIAVVAGTDEVATAESFANFTLTRQAQQAIAGTGWEPVRSDVEWERDGDTVTPDWDAIFERQDELLEEYRTIFGG